jgi:deoxyribodipyrimidine photo-lyase
VRPRIVVFTRDLRVRDHPALHAAATSGAPVLGAFVVDPAMLDGAHRSANRVAYLREALTDLDASLRAIGGRLHVVDAGSDGWSTTVADLARRIDADTVHLSSDHTAHAQRRRAALRAALATHDVALETHPGIAAIEPGRVLPRSGGDHFKVFTPFHRQWELTDPGRPLPAPSALTAVPVPDDLPPSHALDAAAERLGPGSPQRERGGETAALERLSAWTSSSLASFTEIHDDLAADRTSYASAALHFGCLSAREMDVRLRDRPGAPPYVRQLAWRDFFLQLVAVRPEVTVHEVRPRAFVPRVDPEGLEAWRLGRTGFPVVDAAMRQLRAQGFVHNRARMVAASFLTKDLAIDWRVGAAEYLEWLTDGDLAQNQLNWQWVAGTGTDSNPSRIFNPTRQGERFDPDGIYVRQWVPELATVERADIHDPPPLVRAAVGYPLPIVDHPTAIAELRERLSAGRDRGPADR